MRCTALHVADLQGTDDEDDDITIDDGDTAWITHEEDETNVIQLMPRLSAQWWSLPRDYTVQWLFQNAYPRRKGMDDRTFPAEGLA